MKKFLKEFVLLVLVILPFIYLGSIWRNLPERVPIQFDGEGTAKSWSSKAGLLWITIGFVVGMYLLMLILPAVYPKTKMVLMGYDYYNWRFVLALFISALMIFCLHLSNAGKM